MSRILWLCGIALAAVLSLVGCERRGTETGQAATTEETAPISAERATALSLRPRRFDDGPPRVVDLDGQPIAEASVWLCAEGHTSYYPEIIDEAVSDEEGRLAFDQPRVPGARRYALLAHKPGYALGMATFWPDGQAPSIVLPPVGSRRIRVVNGEGEPLPQAGARVDSLALLLRPRIWDPAPVPGLPRLPLGLQEKLAMTADEEGWIALQLCCAQCVRCTLNVTAPGFAEVRLHWPKEAETTVALQSPATLAGVLRCEEPEALSNRLIEIIAFPEPGDDSRTGVIFTVVTDEQGRFRCGKLAAGTCDVRLRHSPDDPWQAEKLEGTVLTAGETTRLTLPLQRRYRVSGRVLTAAGAGVPDVAVVYCLQGDNFSPFADVSDADGSFAFHAPPAEIRLSVWHAPQPYLRTEAYEKALAVAAHDRNRAPDLVLATGVRQRGRVVDQRGRPVAGASVVTLPGQRHYADVVRLSDQAGEFMLPALRAGDTLRLIARKGDAVTATPVRVKVAQGQEVALVLQKGAGRCVKGRLTLDDGRPVPDPWLRTDGGYGPHSSTTSTLIGWIPLAADGSFSSGPLPPAPSYSISIGERLGHSVFDGAVTRDEPWAFGTLHLLPGETRDLGNIVLTRRGVKLTGRVVDTHGRPVRGAAVTSYTAPEPARTVTKRDGAFTLDGLFLDEGYVFAEKRGYYLGGTLSGPGMPGPEIRLCPRGSRAPWADEFTVTLQQVSTEREREIVTAVVTRAVSRLGRPEDSKLRTRLHGLLTAWVRVQPERALATMEELGYYLTDEVRVQAARTLAGSDPQAALEAIEQSDYIKYRQRLVFARELAETAPHVARKLVRTIEQSTRTDGPNMNVTTVARLGAIYLALGERAKATQYMDRALRALAKKQRPHASFVTPVAIALADFDVARARRLVEGTSGEWKRADACLWLALAVADGDPATARALVRTAVRIRPGPMMAVPRDFVYMAAGVNPEFALQVAAENRPGAEGLRDLLARYAIIAVRAAGKHPKAARAALDKMRRLTDGFSARSKLSEGRRRPSPHLSLAAAAVAAAQCGDPNPRDLLLRALAAERGKYSHVGGRDAAEVRMARVVAFMDLELARWLNAPAMLKNMHYRSAHADKAWLPAFSPQEAAQFIEQWLAEHDGSDGPAALPPLADSLVRMLTTPPERRVERVLCEMQLDRDGGVTWPQGCYFEALPLGTHIRDVERWSHATGSP